MRRHITETNILSCYAVCVLMARPGKQADLAERWGVEPHHMSDMKSYKRPVQLDVAVRIAEAETAGSCDALLGAARDWWETEGRVRIVADWPPPLREWLAETIPGAGEAGPRAAAILADLALGDLSEEKRAAGKAKVLAGVADTIRRAADPPPSRRRR